MSRTPAADTHHYTCPWCGQTSSDVTQASCSSCGSPLDVRAAVTRSGWTEMPPIKDMAKLQFGQSFCQIEGMYVPVADFKLAQGDGVYFAHHELLWKDPQTPVALMSHMSWRFAGMLLEARGPGRLALSRDKPGELIALPLSHGQSVNLGQDVFMAATSQVSYDAINSGIWFDIRGEKHVHRHYPLGEYLHRFTAQSAPGLLLLHGGGNVFLRRLEPNQTILVKPTALLFRDPTVTMNMYIEHPGGVWRETPGDWNQRSLWLRLGGPGRVAVQSHYERWEDPDEPVYRMEPGGRVVDW